jgi:hypothetical protein
VARYPRRLAHTSLDLRRLRKGRRNAPLNPSNTAGIRYFWTRPGPLRASDEVTYPPSSSSSSPPSVNVSECLSPFPYAPPDRERPVGGIRGASVGAGGRRRLVSDRCSRTGRRQRGAAARAPPPVSIAYPTGTTHPSVELFPQRSPETFPVGHLAR